MSIRVDNVTSVSNALSTTSETIAGARPTRRQLTLINTDAAINMYINHSATGTAANATSANFTLGPGKQIVVVGTGIWTALAASGTPTLSVMDEYD